MNSNRVCKNCTNMFRSDLRITVEGFVNPTSIGYLPQHQTLVISDPGRDEGEVLLQKLAYDQDSNYKNFTTHLCFFSFVIRH